MDTAALRMGVVIVPVQLAVHPTVTIIPVATTSVPQTAEGVAGAVEVLVVRATRPVIHRSVPAVRLPIKIAVPPTVVIRMRDSAVQQDQVLLPVAPH